MQIPLSKRQWKQPIRTRDDSYCLSTMSFSSDNAILFGCNQTNVMQCLGWIEDQVVRTARVNARCFQATSSGRTCFQDTSAKWGQGLLLRNAINLKAAPVRTTAGVPFTWLAVVWPNLFPRSSGQRFMQADRVNNRLNSMRWIVVKTD